MFCLLNCGCFCKIQLEDKASVLMSATFLFLHLDVLISSVVKWLVITFIAVLPHWILPTWIYIFSFGSMIWEIFSFLFSCLDYKSLGILKRQFPNAPLIGLTATATNHVLKDAQKILHVQKCITFTASFNRPNLYYEVCLIICLFDCIVVMLSTLRYSWWILE